MSNLPMPPALNRRLTPEDLNRDLLEVLGEDAACVTVRDGMITVNGTHAISFKDLQAKVARDFADIPARELVVGDLIPERAALLDAPKKRVQLHGPVAISGRRHFEL
jgi:hypothetical protein